MRTLHQPFPSSERFGTLQAKSSQLIVRAILILAAAFVIAVMIWQGITAKGSPDPTEAHGSKAVAIFDIGVLVFREGLECILVLSAITASMIGNNGVHRRPVAIGAGVGFFATIITWFIAVGVVSNLSKHSGARSPGRDGIARGRRPPGGDELVLPQGLLGRLDWDA